MQTCDEQKQDHGGKELSKTGRDFLIQELRIRGLSADDPGGRESIARIFAPVSARIWVKTLESFPRVVPLSYKSEWEFYGCVLVVVANIRVGEEAQPDAVIYTLCESEARELANNGTSMPEAKFREWANGQKTDEWWWKICHAIGFDAGRSARVGTAQI